MKLCILFVTVLGNGEVQSFLVEPSNVNVTIGQTAILKCQVLNRKGALQWTKDGFALGQNQIYMSINM